MVATVHLRRADGASAVVDLWTAGPDLVRAWGRAGASTLQRAESFFDPAAAWAALERQAARLERKGYRVGHFDLDLERALVAAPDQAAGYLVYADWLLERRDPRGQLIADMAAGHATDVEHLTPAERVQLCPAWWAHGELRCEWRWGFVQHATVVARDWGVVRRVLGHPSLRVLRTLTLEHPVWSLEPSGGWFPPLGPRPPCLRELRVAASSPRQRRWVGQVEGLVLV